MPFITTRHCCAHALMQYKPYVNMLGLSSMVDIVSHVSFEICAVFLCNACQKLLGAAQAISCMQLSCNWRKYKLDLSEVLIPFGHKPLVRLQCVLHDRQWRCCVKCHLWSPACMSSNNKQMQLECGALLASLLSYLTGQATSGQCACFQEDKLIITVMHASYPHLPLRLFTYVVKQSCSSMTSD